MYLPDESAIKPAPPGLHRAVCCRFIDYGTQHSEFYGKSTRKVLIAWELVDEVRETEEGPAPYIVTRYYSWSMHPKSGLRADLESWRGRPFTRDNLSPDGSDRFDVHKLIGASCMINIVHEPNRDGGVDAKVKSITPLPKGTTKPAPIGRPIYLSLDPGEYEPGVFDNLPEKTRDKIKRSPEWKELNGQSTGVRQNGGVDFSGPEFDDEIPF